MQRQGQRRVCGGMAGGVRHIVRYGSALVLALALALCAGWASWAGGNTDGVRAADIPGSVGVSGAWSAVPETKSPTAISRRIEGMAAVRADDIWAAGWSENTRSGQPTAVVPLLTHWDGSAWTMVPVPTPTDRTARLYALTAISATDIWAVGSIAPSTDRADYSQQPLTLHYDGNTWTVIAAPTVAGTSPHAFLSTVTASGPGDVWAAGHDGGTGLVYHWAGTAWARVGVPTASGIVRETIDWNALGSTGAQDVWLVGERRLGQSGGTQPVAAHWDGIAWTLTNTPLPPGVRNRLTGVSARATDDVWAVGEAGTPPDWPTAAPEMRITPFVLHWDGTRWNSVAVPVPDTNATVVALTAVVALTPDEVWITGTYGAKVALGDLVSESAQTFFLHGNGTAWATVSAPNGNNGNSPPFDTPTTLIANGPTDLWCGGQFMGGGPLFLHYG